MSNDDKTDKKATSITGNATPGFPQGPQDMRANQLVSTIISRLASSENPDEKKVAESILEDLKSLKLEDAGIAALLSAMEDFGKWAKEHPVEAGLAAAGVMTICAPGVVYAPILHTLGWGLTGPQLASVVAGIQGATGNFAAGSVFATLQSAAMGGYGVATVSTATSIGGGLVAGAVGLHNAARPVANAMGRLWAKPKL